MRNHFAYPPYVNGSDTSRAAAEAIVPDVGNLRATVYAHVFKLAKDGATCDEVEQALDMRHQTASARIYELNRANLLFDSGYRRKTRSGRSATVWIAERCR